jgi:hypothetical protein
MMKPMPNALAGQPVAPFEAEQETCLFRHRHPMKAYEVTEKSHVVSRHEGLGLSLESAIARELDSLPEADGSGDPYELCIFEGNRLVAVIHARNDAKGTAEVTRFDFDAEGPGAGAGAVTVAAADAIRPTPPGADPDLSTPEPAEDRVDDPEPDDEPDDEDDGPDAPAARRARLRTRGPLFRGMLTFADPGTPDFLVQLEVIVTSENVEGSPGFYDLPQSKEAGWISHAHGTMNVAIRTIS